MEKYSDISIGALHARRLAEEINAELRADGIIEGYHPTLGSTFKIKDIVTIYSDKDLIGINPEIHNQIKHLLPKHTRVRMPSPDRDDLAMYSF